MSFEDDLAAAQTAAVKTRDVDVSVNGTLYTFRFRRMPGMAWALETNRHPARPGILLDTRYGYNLWSLVAAVAPKYADRVDGDTTVPLTAEQWAALLDENSDVLDGAAVQQFGDAVFELNEYGPRAEVDALRKGSTAGSKKGSS